MRIPQDPPLFDSILPQLASGVSLPTRLIARLNDEYVHWDALRHRNDLESYSPEFIWAGLKLSRLGMQQLLPLVDERSRPYWFTQPPAVQAALHEIDKNLGGMLASESPSLPEEHRQRYLINALMEEAIASSQIEGAATTRRVAKEMLRRKRSPKNHSERMIVNNYSTIRWLRDRAREDLTLSLIHQIHRSMTEGTLGIDTDAGRFRRPGEKVWVVTANGEVVHVPPPADQLPERIQRLCDFANSEKEGFVHPVIRAIIVHFMLAYDHPYVDGNGRAARALFYWTMLRHGYWLFEYLPISRIIKDIRRQYERGFLESEHDDGDLTYFIVFNLKAILRAKNDLQTYLERKQRESKRAQRALRSARDLNHRQKELLLNAVKDSGAMWTVQEHATVHGVNPQTARRDLYDLEERGLVRRFKLSRAFVFEPTERVQALVR